MTIRDEPHGFNGFPAPGLDLLAQLADRDTAWLAANRETYDRDLMAPARAFVVDLGAVLGSEVSEGIVADARVNGSIAPVNRDIRFAADKHPYKDHLLFRFWEGAHKRVSPTLFVRLSADGVGFASGMSFSPEQLDRWRAALDGPAGGNLAAAIGDVASIRGAELLGRELKRVPRPFPADHPRAPLLCHKWIQVRWSEKLPASVGKASFVGWCARRLVRAAPLHTALVDTLNPL